jgi:hypothetical protein
LSLIRKITLKIIQSFSFYFNKKKAQGKDFSFWFTPKKIPTVEMKSWKKTANSDGELKRGKKIPSPQTPTNKTGKSSFPTL